MIDEEYVTWFRNQGIQAPILFYGEESIQSTIIPTSMYAHHRVNATSEHAEVVQYGSMKPLPWAPLVEGNFGSTRWAGVVTIHEIIGKGLVAKDPNGLSDPYILFYQGDTQKYKAKKILKTLNPHWEDLSWNLSCEATETLTFEIWDWDRVGGDDFMGEVKFTIISILGALPNVTRPIFTKTFVVTPKKNEKKGKN